MRAFRRGRRCLRSSPVIRWYARARRTCTTRSRAASATVVKSTCLWWERRSSLAPNRLVCGRRERLSPTHLRTVKAKAREGGETTWLDEVSAWIGLVHEAFVQATNARHRSVSRREALRRPAETEEQEHAPEPSPRPARPLLRPAAPGPPPLRWRKMARAILSHLPFRTMGEYSLPLR